MNNNQLTSSFEYFRAVPKTIADIYKDYLKKELQIRNKPRFYEGQTNSDMLQAEKDKKNELAALKTQTLDKLEAIRSKVETTAQTADKALDRELGLRLPGSDVTENLLIETREEKAWNRMKPILDAKNEIDQMTAAVAALASGFVMPMEGDDDQTDYDSLAALIKELPLYIQTRFPANAPEFLNESIDALERAMAAKRPDFVEPLNLKKEMRSGISQVNTALNYLTEGIETDTPETFILGWAKGDVIYLQDGDSI